ncbi:FAD-binding oxidoreductase [Jannaschia pohangensis]|uniref:FAD/FMN-containing dehydrogenase n=1 Tax=Jannaschia pohangensis TaxID=390807 RepID=A0A1I3QDM1_9RHOB|nr:FAD-binding oxidoreductase [Jannaschia pohangensis]SFJ32354.1 FAD/FMN-containing dehydrogenase [Jannaschia pohangensis]
MTPATTIEPALRRDLPEAAFRPLEARYLEEPRGRWSGQGGLLLTPATTQEVSVILRAASAAGVPVVPYGGGTGLVGGQISGDLTTPVILSLERMTRIRSVDATENAMTVEAGVILQQVQEAAKEAGRLFPLTIAAQGSARIGGILSTNAGGVNVLRYGNARDLCLGLEAVLPDGSVLNGLSPLRKNNTGYDLRHLLIGAEGTLGIITAATLKLLPRPVHTGAAIMAVRDPAAALDLLNLARDRIGEGVSAFELIGRMGLEFLAETMPDVRLPIGRPDWSVLIDLGLGASGDPQSALEDLFAAASEAGLVSDGVIAQSEGQRRDFWTVRESIPEGNRRIGSVSSHDISVPTASIPDFIARGTDVIAKIGNFRINCFGHVGDGNLHYNVFPMPGRNRADHDAERDAIKTAVHDLVHEFGGSVSAEHGVGRLKVGDLERYVDPTKLAAMRAIKSALDPKGIMNPGAVLRQVT